MGPTLHEDFVVYMVVEVDSRGIDVDVLSRSLTVPGVEVLRTSRRGMIWLTALVTAPGEATAIGEVQRRVLERVPPGSRIVVATTVAGAPLGDLRARLEAVDLDRTLDRMDLIDLVETALGNSDPGRVEAHPPPARSLGA